MTRPTLTLIRPEVDAAAPDTAPQPETASPLVHLRITGRHGVFLLEQGDATRQNLVDTRAAAGIACTCGASGGNCEHVALLRACGFLPSAA